MGNNWKFRVLSYNTVFMSPLYFAVQSFLMFAGPFRVCGASRSLDACTLRY
jgi:hypothetical protein